MGPVTRLSRRNQTKTKNVLADKTNLPRMSKINGMQEQCLYSHKGEEINVNGGLTVYDFISTNSPPRKIVKKRKPQHKKKLKSGDEIFFQIKKVENIRYNTRRGQVIPANGKNKEKSVTGILTVSRSEENVMRIERKKENIMVKEKRVSFQPEVTEINESKMRDYINDAPIKYLDKIGTDTLNGNAVLPDNVQQDVTCISAYSENKENHSHSDFQLPRCSFGFSPIKQDNKYCYMTKLQNKKKYCVDEFTVENCFGFDEESDDELKSSEHKLYAMCSTPNDRNKPIRPQMLMSRILLPPQVDQPFNKTCNMTKTTKIVKNKNRLCFDSSETFEFPVKMNSSACNNMTSTKLPQVTREVPKVNSLKVTQVTATEIPEVTSTESPILFGDNLTEHFSKPPRKSYERKVRMNWDSQTEVESASEDEICSAARSKGSKKRKVKEDKGFAKWAANVSAEFEEVESFQLYVE